MCRLSIIVLFVAVFAGVPAAAEEWGDLTAKVVIRFQQPPVVPLISIAPNQQIPDEALLVAADGGLANVVLYVRTSSVPVNPELAATVPPHAVLAFQNSMLRPRILPVWIARQAVLFGNLDKVGYNPNIRPVGDQGANPLLPPGATEIYKPNRAQTIPVPVGCNIKPWIRAYLLPRDNPYVAVSDSKGQLKLSKLPARTLEFQLWHEKYGYLDTPQQVKGRFSLEIKPGPNVLGTIVVER